MIERGGGAARFGQNLEEVPRFSQNHSYGGTSIFGKNSEENGVFNLYLNILRSKTNHTH